MSEIPLDPYRPPAAATLEVPEIADVGDLAGRGARLVAVLIDGALLNAPFWFLVQGLEEGEWSDVQLLALGAVVAIVALLQCRLLYDRGQTIGKLALGVRIVRRNGTRAGLPRILLLREAFAALAYQLPFVGGLIALVDALMIFRGDRRCLHDVVADTIVVRARRKAVESPAGGPPPLPPELAAIDLAPR